MLTKLLIYRIRCIRIGLIALIGALCLGAVPATGAHASPQPRTGSLDVADDEVQLMQLGFQDHTLRSSTDEAKVFFTLPSTWDLQPDTKMRLHYAVKITGPMVAAQGSDTSKTSAYVASLNVRLNGKTIAFYPITQDMDSSVDITLARADLHPAAARSARNTLSFTISDNIDCIGLSPVEVTIFNNSSLVLPHTLRSIQPDLMDYPFPLIEQSFDVQGITVVVPQQPTTAELAAAFAVSTSLRDIDKNAPLALVQANDLSDDQRAATHVVLVGQPSRLPLLSGVTLPAQPRDDHFPSLPVGDDDGVVQIAVSPWNSQHALLLVSGATPTAVLRGAQGLDTLHEQAQPQRAVAIVSAVRASQTADFPLDRATFAMLRVPDITLRGLGTSSADAHFTLTARQARFSSGTLNISIAHSALLNGGLSNVTIELNGTVVGNIRLDDDNAQGRVVTMRLPTTALKPGDNRLSVSALMRALSDCGKPSGDDIWLTVHNDSMFSISRENLIDPELPFTLDRYPAPFSYDPDLANLAFVLPAGDPHSWNIAQHMIMYLADMAGSQVVSPTILFADTPASEVRSDLHLIMIGQPRALPLLAELSDQLPIVFAPGTNDPDDRRSRVVMHFAPPEQQGYLQIVPAPWNTRRVVLLVLGRDDQELSWAASGLTDSALRRQLSGELALVQADVVITPQLIATAQPTSAVPSVDPPESSNAPGASLPARPTPATAGAGAAANQPAPAKQPASWTLPIVMLLAIISGVILGLRMWIRQQEVS